MDNRGVRNRPIIRILATCALVDLAGSLTTAALGAITRDYSFMFTSMAMVVAFFALLFGITQIEKTGGE